MKKLTAQQLRQYQEDGAVHPLRAIPVQRAQRYLALLEEGEARYGAAFRKTLRTKAHLSLKWVDELVHDPGILDAVEDVIGPDILLYNMSVWIKDALDPNFVGWHQDSTYFPLEPAVQVAAWVALTDSVAENGNVKYLRGSHLLGQLKHGKGEAGSLLSQGQYVETPPDCQIVDIFLEPGQMSLHHTRLVHFSEPNHSSRRRIGIAVSYIPTSVVCTCTVRHTAMLVRGTDRYGHFDPEPRVRFDFDPEVEAFKQDAVARFWQAAAEQAQVHARMLGKGPGGRPRSDGSLQQ